MPEDIQRGFAENTACSSERCEGGFPLLVFVVFDVLENIVKQFVNEEDAMHDVHRVKRITGYGTPG